MSVNLRIRAGTRVFSILYFVNTCEWWYRWIRRSHFGTISPKTWQVHHFSCFIWAIDAVSGSNFALPTCTCFFTPLSLPLSQTTAFFWRRRVHIFACSGCTLSFLCCTTLRKKKPQKTAIKLEVFVSIEPTCNSAHIALIGGISSHFWWAMTRLMSSLALVVAAVVVVNFVFIVIVTVVVISF